MLKPVNWGIDLGTTNSLIAHFSDGEVRILKNPIGLKETLPSVVAFRNTRVIIGDKAREFLSKDSPNVIGGFKRKMGTDEKFYIVDQDENVTPIELSAMVLKELKKFALSEVPEACVITVPAAFDSIQCNATIKAGNEAGFDTVFLLQEPVAACLSFFNSNKDTGNSKIGHWMVYDLGGGTFDVALVHATEQDIKVVDHEGNNFLGGLDIDQAIVKEIILPELKNLIPDSDFENEFVQKFGKYESIYYQALYHAEEAKKELSNANETYIEFGFLFNNAFIEISVPFSNEQLDEICKPILAETVGMLNNILSRNRLSNIQINALILVGGSTYLRQFRSGLQEASGIKVYTDIDPVDSIARGAAHYASSKFYLPRSNSSEINFQKEKDAVNENQQIDDVNAELDITVNLSYNNSSQDTEEVLIIQTEGDFEQHNYRIIRSDGGYDSGITEMRQKKTEFIPLLSGVRNIFMFQVLNKEQQIIHELSKEISINQGQYTIDGQPLPHDICVEVDDIDNLTTKLEVLFERNSLLPQKRTLYRTISHNIKKGSTDKIVINFLEGNRNSKPLSNQPIGSIEISGKELATDLLKGSDIEIQVTIDDSRVIKVLAYIVMTQQEFKNVFSFSERKLSLSRLNEQFVLLEKQLGETIRDFQFNDREEWETYANSLMEELRTIGKSLFSLKENDNSDLKYKLASRIMAISKEADQIGGNERIAELIEQYFYLKDELVKSAQGVQFDTDKIKMGLNKLNQSEPLLIASKNASAFENKFAQMRDLQWEINICKPGFIVSMYVRLKGLEPEEYSNYRAAQSIFKITDKELDLGNIGEVRRNIFNLLRILNVAEKHFSKEFKGTGIG